MKAFFIIIALVTFVTETRLAFTETATENKSVYSYIENSFIGNKDQRYVNFVSLTKEREDLLVAIQNHQDDLSSLESKKNIHLFRKEDIENSIKKNESELIKSKNSIFSGELISSAPQEIQSRINSLKNDLNDNNGDIKKTLEQIEEKKKSIIQSRTNLIRKETDIQRVLSIEIARQNFQKEISIAFALLVAMVILSFFSIARKDERVRQAIFSGQAGIQFITLFSLVIAIILFGITGILEGKELAALLGGLSGYILGRVTSERREATVPTGSTQQPSQSNVPNGQVLYSSQPAERNKEKTSQDGQSTSPS